MKMGEQANAVGGQPSKGGFETRSPASAAVGVPRLALGETAKRSGQNS